MKEPEIIEINESDLVHLPEKSVYNWNFYMWGDKEIHIKHHDDCFEIHVSLVEGDKRTHFGSGYDYLDGKIIIHVGEYFC